MTGHSYLPNDSNFGEIKRTLKRQIRFYTHQEFKDVMVNYSKRRKFIVHEMEKE